jgi:hypothetical protein
LWSARRYLVGMTPSSARLLVRARLQTYMAQLRVFMQCESTARQLPTNDDALATLSSAAQQLDYFFRRLQAAMAIARPMIP